MMNKNLSENDRLLLRSIFAPEVATVPFSDSHQINMCQRPDGEIRHYGYKKIKDEYHRVYIASKDAGLSWKTVFVSDKQENGAMTQSPWSGDFIAIERSDKHNTSCVRFESLILPVLNQEPKGVYVIRSNQGPGSKEHTLKKISDSVLLYPRQPIPMLSRKRWLCVTQKWDNGALTPVVLLSDDD
ncbi:MAG: hypothetical protein PHF48_08645, partial [Bacteroidales bacterium]|nr:hypothetical protein [Bacteroidales bacterium]